MTPFGLEPDDGIGHIGFVSDGAATDSALWARALEGDESAFGAVYDRYAHRVLTYAYRRTASVQAAEDVVSLVMLEAWRRRREVRFDDDGTIAGWLFRTAHYVLANDARSRRRHGRALSRVAGLAQPDSGDIDRRLIDDERLRRALDALATLSARDRDVLQLAAWSGLSEVEMAGVLGIPIGTFKSRLSRARRRLTERCDTQARPVAVLRLAANSEELP